MKKTLMLAAMVVSAVAFAGPPPAPAAAPAKAAPAAAAPAAAAPAAIAVGDCDMHKAEAAMMKDVMGSKAKVQMVKLDNGTTSIITADAKSAKIVETAMMGMDGHMKEAMEGKASMCDECKGKLAAMKSGKVMGGHGHNGNVWTMTMLSSDPETVKMMHAQLDAKAPAAPAVPAKK